MEVWATNLRDALNLAIAAQEQSERQQNYASDSAILRGWKDLRDKIERHEVSAVYLKFE